MKPLLVILFFLITVTFLGAVAVSILFPDRDPTTPEILACGIIATLVLFCLHGCV